MNTTDTQETALLRFKKDVKLNRFWSLVELGMIVAIVVAIAYVFTQLPKNW